MKKYSLLLFTICSLPIVTMIAQNAPDTFIKKITPKDTTLSSKDEFKVNLLGTYLDFDTARTFGEMMAASNRLKLIASRYNDQWAAQYYAGYMLGVLSFIEKDDSKRDSYIDEAEIYFRTAKSLFKKNYDEIYTLGALLASARLSVKPGSRYKKYGEIFNAYIDSAKTLNPDNPRIYYLQGNSIFYTPKLFGGGAKKALPYYEKALLLYQNEKTDNILSPYWGKKQSEDMLKKCKE